MHPLVLGGVECGVAAVAALVTAGPRWRRQLGLLLGCACVALPFLARPRAPLLCFVIGLVAVVAVMRSIDLARDDSRLPWPRRLWLMFAVFDIRRVERRQPGFDLGPAAAVAVATAIAAGGFALGVYLANQYVGPAHWALRWVGGVIFAVAAFEAATRGLPIAYGLIGLRPPPLHDAPYLSRSMSEFWGVRWNKVVGSWLRANCFTPLARRHRAGLGIVASFAASALLHWYLVVVALGLKWSLVMAAFFLVQLVFLAAERLLGVKRWRAAAARTWTLGIMLAASPLFIEPMIRLVDPLV